MLLYLSGPVKKEREVEEGEYKGESLLVYLFDGLKKESSMARSCLYVKTN